MIAGSGVLAYPIGTDLFSRYEQGKLGSVFTSSQARAQYRSRTIPVGQGLTRLRISAMGLDVLVVEGTTPAALRAGAGHYVGTPLPGETGNVSIAGHRTTFGRPFNQLDRLQLGDTAELETPFNVYTYQLVAPFDGHANPWVVSPNDFQVTDRHGDVRELTLTTCNPKGSARERLIARFVLVADRALPGGNAS